MKKIKTNELESVMRLLIAILLKLGASSEEIALALGVDASYIRHMMPVKKIKRLEIVK